MLSVFRRRSVIVPWLLVVMAALLTGCMAQTLSPNAEPAPQSVPASTTASTPVPSLPKADAVNAASNGITVTRVDGTTVIGPYREYTSPLTWVGDDALAFSKEHVADLLVDLRSTQTYPLPSIKSHSTALSPDHSRLAWIAEGKLIVRDLTTSRDQSWELTSLKESSFGEMLSWSPNGRYLIGQIHPDAEIGALWALDTEANKLIGLVNEKHAFLQSHWSPDGHQLVIMEGLRPHSSSPSRQWRRINLLTGESQVITPKIGDQRQYQFSWDAKGELTTRLVWPGPNETLVLPYDPTLKQHQDERDYAIDGMLETELHFLDAQRKLKDSIDLLPSLQAAGIPCTQKDRLVVIVFPSPDGRYLYLDGQGSQTPAQGATAINYSIHGVVDLTTRSVRFLPFDKGSDRSGFGWLEGRYRWLGQQVLLTPGINSDMSLLNVETLKLTPIPLSQEVITARCISNQVVYVTHHEVGLFSPSSERQVLLSAGDSDELVGAVFSPNGTQLAVTLERRGGSGPVRYAHVIPLK